MSSHRRMTVVSLLAAGTLVVSPHGLGGEVENPSRFSTATRRAAPSTVTWSPERPVQGHLFTVRVTPDTGERIEAVDGSAAGEALHFEPTGDGAFESLAPVPVDATGRLVLDVTVIHAGGREEVLAPSVSVSRSWR